MQWTWATTEFKTGNLQRQTIVASFHQCILIDNKFTSVLEAFPHCSCTATVTQRGYLQANKGFLSLCYIHSTLASLLRIQTRSPVTGGFYDVAICPLGIFTQTTLESSERCDILLIMSVAMHNHFPLQKLIQFGNMML